MERLWGGHTVEHMASSRLTGYVLRSARAAAMLGAGLACLATAADAQGQAPQASTFIIVDGSGSMAAPFANTRVPKIGLTREAIARSLSRVPSGFKVGVAAFGHRRGDCLD